MFLYIIWNYQVVKHTEIIVHACVCTRKIRALFVKRTKKKRSELFTNLLEEGIMVDFYYYFYGWKSHLFH